MLADAGHSISVRVTATKRGWWTATASTPATSKVPLEQITMVKKPRMKGRLRVGNLVRVTTGSWSADEVCFRYTWYADSAPIRGGGVHGGMRITSKLLGQKISVKVTVIAEGYRRFKIIVRAPGRVRG